MATKNAASKGNSKKNQPKSKEPAKAKLVETKEDKSKAINQRKAEQAELQVRFETELEKRSYIPKAGTGKFFHVIFEVPSHNSAGKKVSESRIQIMEFKPFVLWLQEASRLGFAFAVLHDASPFYAKSMDSVIKAMKSYAKAVNLGTYEFGVNKLIKDGDNNQLNMLLSSYLSKRMSYESAQKKKAKSNDYLD